MPNENKEVYLVSKNFDRMFMSFLVIGGITLYIVIPWLLLING